MRRREFITLLGGAAATWPLVARAQQPERIYRIGILIPSPREAPAVAAMFDELRINGFIEGQNLIVIPGGFDVRNDQAAEIISTLVKAAPDAIVSAYPKQTQAMTRTIPIIAMTEDMIAEGIVLSLARPGGNVTGISILSLQLDEKRQGLLMEMVPRARKMAALADSTNTSPQHLATLQQATRARGVELSVHAIAKREEIAPAINAAKASGAEAINFLATPLYTINRAMVFERLRALRLPAIHQWPDIAEDGGLAAYGPRFDEMFRQRARLLVKVLRGSEPADIPVEQPTRFELVINLKTAKALGYEVPAGLVLRADKVIE